MESKKTPSYKELVGSVDPNLLEKWKKEQDDLKTNFQEKNSLSSDVRFVAGCDITFSQEHQSFAITTAAVLDDKLNLVKIQSQVSKIDVPYVPGFLAFREVPQMIDLFAKVSKSLASKFENAKINCIFVDGNGILHPRECGLATHLGTTLNIPTIGCAKTIFAIDGINNSMINTIKEKFRDEHQGEAGIAIPLKGNSGKIWGMALKNSPKAFDPLIVSVGNMIDIHTATDLVKKYSKNRVVEPVRICDKHSRFLIKKFNEFYPVAKKEGLDDDEILKQFQNQIDTKLDHV
jgi:deoxyinosine 3'endonuclease (endonuclease V)